MCTSILRVLIYRSSEAAAVGRSDWALGRKYDGPNALHNILVDLPRHRVYRDVPDNIIHRPYNNNIMMYIV